MKDFCAVSKTKGMVIDIIIGFFMTLLDTTIVNISLPRMAYYFNKNVQDITWVTNGFNIAFAITILTASRLGDQFGRKNYSYSD